MAQFYKNFDKWNELKKELHFSQKPQNFYFREREIWWCSLGVNIGFEQDGKNDNFERPVLIIRKFNAEVLWILPLTSKGKNNKYYYKFNYKNNPQNVILSQIKLISSKRLLRKIWMFPNNDFRKVKELTSDFLR
ncbi:MAG: type II toxin-antitoxin system PemK/MazF family toxin [Candidatus Nealsonbacteria bacterium]|nr:type II toxin-antitoxin system PemK/MazF family toxin [Candidatus Nealsonbacteria bacterium]